MISFSCSQMNTRKQQEDHGERNKAIRSVVETLPNIDQLKPEQDQALLSFVGGQDVVALLPTGFGKPGGALTRTVHPGLIQGPVQMYRTSYQAGMYKTALKKCLLPRAHVRE